MLAVIGSITTATRLSGIIESRTGTPCHIARTPSALQSGGCSYAVRFDSKYMSEAQKLAKMYGIEIKSLYGDRGERV